MGLISSLPFTPRKEPLHLLLLLENLMLQGCKTFRETKKELLNLFSDRFPEQKLFQINLVFGCVFFKKPLYCGFSKFCVPWLLLV